MATTYADASELEVKLKQIVDDHPRVRIHPHSPSGPFVRAVMWSADQQVLGQAFQEADGKTWVVRAFRLNVGQDSLVVEHPESLADIPAAITSVIDRLA